MAIVLGKSGMQMVSSLLAFNPVLRLSSREVLEHPFITVCRFPLMGLCNEEAKSDSGSGSQGYGRISDSTYGSQGYGRRIFRQMFTETIGQSLLAGERHRWRIRVGELKRELVLYILDDDVFIEGTAANALVVLLASGGEIVKAMQ